ncbi:helix-turn-helix transcriptional regulator [Corticicoccus populi]|uniref:Helix-turn-helix transcriptional regulator n=1 Tax=Corticicoccus populi TaxID=1812821 RepID=A0ABW5WY31_9STAP
MNTIKKKRSKKGLTQYQLAVLMGLSTATISYYERGVKRPSLHNAFKLARVLDTSIEDIFPLDAVIHEKEAN